MAKCVYCGSETELFDSGTPICVQCSEEREAKRKPPAPTQKTIRATLLQNVLEATARSNAATREFELVLDQIPSGLPQPDGAQRIKNASNALTIALKEMTSAHNRLNDYLTRGIVPEDLKRSG